jgi:hypothetical protein
MIYNIFKLRQWIKSTNYNIPNVIVIYFSWRGSKGMEIATNIQHNTYEYAHDAFTRLKKEHLSWQHLTTVTVQYYQRG